MSKRINVKKKVSNSKIPGTATQVKISYDNLPARLAFSSVCDQYCLLSEWQGEELRLLINLFKLLETTSWIEIKRHPGLNYHSIDKIALARPRSLPPDASLDSIDVNKKMRLYGYRVCDVFNIIWFDKNHIVCPMNKAKKNAI